MRRRSFAVGILGSLACGSERAGQVPRAPVPAAEPEVAPAPAAEARAEAPVVAEAGAGPRRIGAAALAERSAALQARHAGRGFTIVVEAPFVVVGDGPAEAVARRAERTIRWAVTRLRQDYFADDPRSIVDVYLFADGPSYLRNTKALFGEEPDTPYGYYSPTHAALIMNIATGGGTLVHEIVHPFMAANFPACPDWFNEGLASLYEQCDEQGGRIVGLPNWRLPGLQAAIRGKRLGATRALCATTREEFYGVHSGTHYAHARYLCHYLQEQGRLRDYYHAFVAAAAGDPTGWETLRGIVGYDDMERFELDWRRYVMGLRWS